MTKYSEIKKPLVSSLADALTNGAKINGTLFKGDADIITEVWGTPRVFQIGDTSVTYDGSTDLKIDLKDMGGVNSQAHKFGKETPMGSAPIGAWSTFSSLAGAGSDWPNIGQDVVDWNLICYGDIDKPSQMAIEVRSNKLFIRSKPGSSWGEWLDVTDKSGGGSGGEYVEYERIWPDVPTDGAAHGANVLIDERIGDLVLEPGTQTVDLEFTYDAAFITNLTTNGHLGVSLRAQGHEVIGTTGAGIILGAFGPDQSVVVIPEFWGANTTGPTNWLTNHARSPILVEGTRYRIICSYTIKDVQQRSGDAWISYAIYKWLPQQIQREDQWELLYDSGTVLNPNLLMKDARPGSDNAILFWITDTTGVKPPFFTNVKTVWSTKPRDMPTSVLSPLMSNPSHLRTWRMSRHGDTAIRISAHSSNVFSYPLDPSWVSFITPATILRTAGLSDNVVYYVIPDGRTENYALKIKAVSNIQPAWDRTYGWVIGGDQLSKMIPILGAFILEGGKLYDDPSKRHVLSFANPPRRTLYNGIPNNVQTSGNNATPIGECSYLCMGLTAGIDWHELHSLEWGFMVGMEIPREGAYAIYTEVADPNYRAIPSAGATGHATYSSSSGRVGQTTGSHGVLYQCASPAPFKAKVRAVFVDLHSALGGVTLYGASGHQSLQCSFHGAIVDRW